ncbi:MAG: DedA family protein [Nocardioidaceae bacterium]
MITEIQTLPPLAAYAIIAALVFGEAAIFLGFVLPGETGVVLGGFLASQHQLNIVTLCVIVVISAIVGDTVGYEVGRVFGPRIVATKIFRNHQRRLESARSMLSQRGGPAVLIGRFTAFFRAVMPGLAGLSGMRYRKFLLWNALGGITWGIAFSLVGYFAGASYQKVASEIGTGSAIAIGVLIVVLLVVWEIRKRRKESTEDEEWSASHPEDPAPEDVSRST